MPRLLAIAGPNGSGKSVITARIELVGKYVNADDIKRQLGCSDLDAAKTAEATREYLLKNKEDFSFETVLSTMRNIDLMRRAKESGFYVACIYILTKSPDINVERVKNRAKNGGHDVSEEKIRTRFIRSVRLIPRLFEICDELYIYDNSVNTPAGSGYLLAEYKKGLPILFPNSIWSIEMISSLIRGEYADEYLS